MTDRQIIELARIQDRLNNGEGKNGMPLQPENITRCDFPYYEAITFSDGTKMKFDADGSFFKPDLLTKFFDWICGKK